MRASIIFWICLLLFLPVSGIAASAPLRITVLGDSLTAGYGLPVSQAFPAQLEAALQQLGYNVVVQNAGVSGDTSAGGLARLDWTLADKPDLVIVELGANDALRGLDPLHTQDNIAAILTRLKEAGVQSLLVGMKAPRSLGRDYYTKFDQLYFNLVQSYKVPFYPFFLEGVAGRPELNQADGIHPTVTGISTITQNILPLVKKTLTAIEKSSGR